MKDPSKPDGEAVNADGSLKDANQIKWVDSPTDELCLPILGPNEDMPVPVGDAAKPGNMPARWQFGSKHDSEDDMDIDLHHDANNLKPVSEDENLDDSDGHGEDEKNEEDGNKEEDQVDAGEENIDEEADKRYWEAKAKEGVSKVCA
jgi:hypothetical protein